MGQAEGLQSARYSLFVRLHKTSVRNSAFLEKRTWFNVAKASLTIVKNARNTMGNDWLALSSVAQATPRLRIARPRRSGQIGIQPEFVARVANITSDQIACNGCKPWPPHRGAVSRLTSPM